MKQFFSPKFRRALRFIFSIIQIIFDIMLFNLCLSPMYTSLTFGLCAFLTGTMAIFFFFSRLYGFILWTFHDEMTAVVRSWVFIALVSIVFLYISKFSGSFILFIALLALFIPVTLAARYLFRRILFSVGLLSTSVIIVGSGMAAEMFAENISVSPFIARRVIGFLDDDESKQNKILSGVHVLGRLKDFQRIQSEVQADEAVIALPKTSRQNIEDTLNLIEDNVKRVLYIPDMYMLKAYPAQIRRFEYIPVISTSQGLLNPMNRFIKATMDYIGGFFALIVFSPLMLYVALKIKREDKGNILFRHKRIGRDLKPFYVYKFRSMIPNAEEVLKEMLKDEKLRREFEEAFKFKDDPRITEIGKFLRKTSLDELPQIFNVLKGEMSLVGSRPIVQKEVDLYYGYKTAKQIFHAKPGMTGLWQVSGRNDVEDYDQRIEYDLYYICNWSAWLDIIIMFRTVKAIFSGKGAY
ncbi:MAG: sugar transferase [Synergistaceae bacterium]|nr:sugar transferase [Synergistaceae bacterium]